MDGKDKNCQCSGQWDGQWQLAKLGDPQDEADNGGLGFEVVTGLGVGNMPTNPNTVHNPGFGVRVGNNLGVSYTEAGKGLDLEQRLDIEIKNQLKKPIKDKKETGEEVKNKKFKFRKKGRLTKEEAVELSRTNKNMFNLLKVVAPTVKSYDLVIEDDGQDE